MITSTVSSKGQITIPKEIRKVLKVEQADKVVFTPLEDGTVLISNEKKGANALFGMLRHRKLTRDVTLSQMDEAIRKKRSQRGTA
ncbi:MAG: type II toxin-antitoxin system PrlF family antitoxin [Desulfobacterales bacterium]|nr:type II toxin-antitoxin system PrlF family antitoxin [Desulfobacterales bacterium]